MTLAPPPWQCSVGEGERLGSDALLALWALTRCLGCSSVTEENAWLHLGRLMPSFCHIISDTALKVAILVTSFSIGLPGTQAEDKRATGT